MGNLKVKELFEQFKKFFVLGLLNFGLSKGIYWGLLYIWKDMAPEAANTIGWFTTVFVAYFMQKKFVFKGKKKFSQLVKTYIVYFFTFLIEQGMLFVSVRKFGFDKNIAILFSMPVTIPLNFLLNKIWANKERIGNG